MTGSGRAEELRGCVSTEVKTSSEVSIVRTPAGSARREGQGVNLRCRDEIETLSERLRDEGDYGREADG